MIEADDVKSVADSLGMALTQEQIDSVVKLYESEQDDDPSAEWYLVVEKIIYDVTS